MAKPDTLDHLVGFLQKREGIDKTLKLIRYTSRLVAAYAPKDSDTFTRFSALEKSVGVSRKAYRLGKFLQDVNNMRKSNATGHIALLELVAYGGEGVYYFIEQIVWLIKTGAISKDLEKQLSYISACAELFGYAANIWLSVIKIKELAAKEAKLVASLSKKQVEDNDVSAQVAVVQAELAKVRFAKSLKTWSIVQDVSDSLLAFNDVRGGVDRGLSHPATLAIAGLVSGSISFYKNWNS